MNNIKAILAADAKEILKNNDAILIDVREPAEHRSHKIPNAINIPLSKISSQRLRDHKIQGKKVILHCQSGNRSKQACQKVIADADFELFDLAGGIEAWSQNGFETEKSAGSVLPLNRQVQLVISLMILSGLLLYYFVSPYGLLLPLMAGLGLMNAALTGWCGMAKFLAIMSWNK